MKLAPDRGKATRIRDMFATIVPHYDMINTLMTLGLDRRWRRITVAMAEPAAALALDIATGTGELAFELERAGARAVVGIDFCYEMVAAAVRKCTADLGRRVGTAFSRRNLRLRRQRLYAAQRRRPRRHLQRTASRVETRRPPGVPR